MSLTSIVHLQLFLGFGSSSTADDLPNTIIFILHMLFINMWVV